MEVVILYPLGYCQGVARAIEMALRAKKENKGKTVYLLGALVHNEEALRRLKKEGLLLLDEKQGDLESLLSKAKEGSVVVFSAHGHDKKLDAIAESRNLKIYDSTCPHVENNLKDALRQERPIIYIGKSGHAESLAFMANCPKAHFYDVEKNEGDIEGLNGDPYVVSQTTLSFYELEKAHESILSRYPGATIGEERCPSTTLRQRSVMELGQDIDLLIVVGSKGSANSNKLVEIGKEKGLESILVENLKELAKLDLSGKKKVALASGASTPMEDIKECVRYLRYLNN